jgi:hypothetical protein
MGAYETKVIIKSMAKLVARSTSLENAYNDIAEAARDEGMSLPSYEEERSRTKIEGDNKNI